MPEVPPLCPWWLFNQQNNNTDRFGIRAASAKVASSACRPNHEAAKQIVAEEKVIFSFDFHILHAVEGGCRGSDEQAGVSHSRGIMRRRRRIIARLNDGNFTQQP